MYTGTILAHRVTQTVFDFPLMFLRAHIDEVDDDEATKVAQPQLACDFFRSLEVCGQGGGFDVFALGGACRVDIDRNQRFRMVDHDAAARGQVDRMREGRFYLAFDLVTGKERHRIRVMLEFARVLRHYLLDKLVGFLVGLLVVDEDFADIAGEIVTQRANHGIALAINQEGRGPFYDDFLDCFPDGQQVFEVPAELFR